LSARLSWSASSSSLPSATASASERKKARIRLVVESVFANLKRQMRLGEHLAKTVGGLVQRVAQRLLALTLGIFCNLLAGRPARALVAYDGRQTHISPLVGHYDDPGSWRRVDPPIDPRTGKPTEIWCWGTSLLADGRVQVTGGNLDHDPAHVSAGLKRCSRSTRGRSPGRATSRCASTPPVWRRHQWLRRPGDRVTDDTVEVYSPPYLFAEDGSPLGPDERPRIASAPTTGTLGDVINVATAGVPAARAVLVAPGAATHAPT
jgi:hypothetical protein